MKDKEITDYSPGRQGQVNCLSEMLLECVRTIPAVLMEPSLVQLCLVLRNYRLGSP